MQQLDNTTLGFYTSNKRLFTNQRNLKGNYISMKSRNEQQALTDNELKVKQEKRPQETQRIGHDKAATKIPDSRQPMNKYASQNQLPPTASTT